jgi:hypothetical protein
MNLLGGCAKVKLLSFKTEVHMSKLISVALAAAAIAAVSGVADARDGCGPGFYFNGYRCRPMEREDYGPPRYVPAPRYVNPGHPYGYRHDYGDPRCGRPNYTIQDGVCKPYTGR